MPIKAYINDKFSTTHENQIFNDLIQNLEVRWGNSDELIILIGNFFCGNNEIDAMIVKKDSISFIEFKNYEGKI
jgi:Holliday junction resolvase-like predicted endonuclease